MSKKSNDFELNRSDLDFLIGCCAFRYCLGRSSYAVSWCVEAILNNWDKFSRSSQYNIYREICMAKDENRLGMEMDAAEWKKIVDHYESIYGYRGINSPLNSK